MTTLATSVTVDGTVYPAGTDHTQLPAAVLDRIRNPAAWTGGTAPATGIAHFGKPEIVADDLRTPARARAALGLLNLDPSALTVGEEVLPRLLGSGAAGLASGTIFLSYFTARKTETIGHLRTLTSGTAAAGLTLARMGVYSVGAAGALTRVAQTGSDTTLWSATYTAYNASTGSWVKQYGARYAFAVLAIGTTMPQLAGAGINYADAALEPRLVGVVPSQTDLPTTITAAAVQPDYRVIQGFLLP